MAEKKQALQGTRMNGFKMDPEDVVIVGIDTDHKKGDHPLWDKRIELPISDGLVKSMMKYGNIQAITVRKNGNIPEVVDGRQRVRAAREANKRLAEAGKETMKIKVLAQRGQDVTMLGVMITTNEVREGNAPMAKARLLEQLIAMGASDADAAIAFGVTTTAVRQWKILLDLHVEIQEAVDAGQISASAASELASLNREEQLKQFKEAMEAGGGKVTAQQTRQRRQRATRDPAATPFTAPRKPVVRKVVKALDDNGSTPLSHEAISVLKWTLGLCDAAEVPGLEEALRDMEASKMQKKEKEIKLSDAQKTLLDLLEESEQLATQLNSKTLNALIKRGLAEVKDGPDGLSYAFKVVATELDNAQNSASVESEVAA